MLSIAAAADFILDLSVISLLVAICGSHGDHEGAHGSEPEEVDVIASLLESWRIAIILGDQHLDLPKLGEAGGSDHDKEVIGGAKRELYNGGGGDEPAESVDLEVATVAAVEMIVKGRISRLVDTVPTILSLTGPNF